MCRLAAIRTDRPDHRVAVLEGLRALADHSYTGPEDHRSHRDGWGIVGPTRQGLTYWGRSAEDASQDPAYGKAVEAAHAVLPHSVTIAHVRNASVGNRCVENAHPFVRDGWAFCHNGTVRDLAIPNGAEAEGDTDSERYFLQLLAHMKASKSPLEGIRRTVQELDRAYAYSSLTFLLTDGHEVYAFRRVGEPGSCGTRECALEYYTLGFGYLGNSLVVFQEPRVLRGLERWQEIPDGTLLHVSSQGQPRFIPLLAPAPRAT